MSLLDIVRGYAAGGLSCIPILANGTKAPALPGGHPVLNRHRSATPAELGAWFDDRGWGVAIQGGERSGGLVVFDFDGEAGLALYERWADDLEQEVPGVLAALPQVQTPRGRHVYARCPGHAPGNQKLARGVDGKAVIETRGEGGYVLAPGCPCECHPDRKMYVLAPGPALAEVPTVTQDQLACLLDLARARDASPREEVRPAAAPVPADEQRPGDIFNVRGAWEDVLVGAGWTRVRERGGLTYWRRPGKSDPGCSATTGIRSESGKDLLYVFSTNAHPFQDARSYTKFAAHALLNHGGDWGAAARELRGRGFVAEPDIHGVKLKYGERNGHAPRPNADTSTDPLDQDATALDLILINATIRWAWKGWLPIGVLSILASEPGVGKTRFLADLARRIYLGLPWPDGSPATFPPGSTTLWVAADNHHAELGTLPTEFGFPPESLYLNTTRRDPFGGTMLDDPEDLKDFEARIRRVKPACVFIDTTLNATERSAHKPEDAKAFFGPLQQIVARQDLVMLGSTHTNAGGKPLGRRIMGQARLVMQLDRPDPEQEHRRKLYVVKSNSLYPAALGVTMGNVGNEYDTEPPEKPPEGPGARADAKLTEAMDWLRDRLRMSPQRVGNTREAAEMAGISARTLYRARDAIGVEEYLSEGKKWWRLTSESP